MRKSFFFIFLILMYVSLFLMPESVFADTYNFTFQSDPYTYINSSSYNTFKSQLFDYIDTLPTANYHYMIFWQSNKYVASVFLPDTLVINFGDINTNYPNVNVQTSQRGELYQFCDNNGVGYQCYHGDSNSNIGTIITNCRKNHRDCDTIYLLETDITNFTTSVSDTFIVTYNDETFTFPNSDNLYTAVSWYNYYHGDEYPLLTQFFTLSIEKLVLVTEYISSNYIFLSMFTIFIIYFSILLIRRLL